MKSGDRVWYAPPRMKAAAVVVDPDLGDGLSRIRVECVDQKSHTIVPMEFNIKTENLKPRRAWAAVDEMKG
jgi:hypothetical protein